MSVQQLKGLFFSGFVAERKAAAAAAEFEAGGRRRRRSRATAASGVETERQRTAKAFHAAGSFDGECEIPKKTTTGLKNENKSLRGLLTTTTGSRESRETL